MKILAIGLNGHFQTEELQSTPSSNPTFVRRNVAETMTQQTGKPHLQNWLSFR
jgi:hypothetical protein